MVKNRAVWVFGLAALAVALSPHALAQTVVGCGCFCGKTLPPPCSEEACKSACASSFSLPSTPALSGNPGNAAEVSTLRQRAEGGDPQAQTLLGSMYASGENGLPRDEPQAVSWYRKAAEQSYGPAECQLGMEYENGGGGLPKDDAQAASWYRKAAEKDVKECQLNLALMYDKGRGGLPKNEIQAMQWYRKAAQQGVARAQFDLGAMYVEARGGLPKDESQAVFWFRKAADQDYAPAENELGFMYRKGRGGLPQDDFQAAYWYRKAAEQDYPPAQNNLAWLYATSSNPQIRNPELAVRFAQKAVATEINSDNFDTLAEAYYAHEEFQKAVEAEQRAVNLAPNEDKPDLQVKLKKYERARQLGHAIPEQ